MLGLDDILSGILTGVVAGVVIAGVGLALRYYWDNYRPLRVVEWSIPERIEIGHILAPENDPLPVRLLTIRARNRSSGPIHLHVMHIGLRGDLASEPLISDALDRRGDPGRDLMVRAREFRTIDVRATVDRGSSVRIHLSLLALGYRRRVGGGWILEINGSDEPTVRAEKRRPEERSLP